MTEIDNELKLSCLRALQGHVPPCLRTVSLELIDNIINFQAILDKDASEDDIELLSMAAGELIADFNGYGLNEIIKIIPFPEIYPPLNNLVFLRHEHNYYKNK